jgi:ABC-type dipeptide/oligopeptide/nickel transport system permease component
MSRVLIFFLKAVRHMVTYVLKRLLRSAVSMFLIIVIVFCLLRMMPIEGYFPTNYDKLTPQQLENSLAKLGLDRPVPEQLFNFFKNLLTKGDLGLSTRYHYNRPVLDIIADKAPISLRFGFISLLFSLPLGFLLGILMARKAGGVWDKVGTAYIVMMQAIPFAVFAILIQLYGTMALKTFFPRMGMLYDLDYPVTMITPIIMLTIGGIAGNALWLRRYMVDESNRDYIKLARSKGVPTTAIFFRHVFRNSAVPMVQGIPGAILFTIVGSIYVESLCSIPGTGGLLVDAVKRQDNPLVQALVIIYALLGITGLLLGDLLMALVDPRIKLYKKEAVR